MYIMENTKKIIVSYFISLILVSCQSKVRNSELLIQQNDSLFLKFYNISQHDTTIVKHIIKEDKITDLKTIIHPSSFDILANFEEDSLAIRNPYNLQKTNKNQFLYRDKNFLYFLIDTGVGNEHLKYMCKIPDYQLLGGDYIKIGSNVYYSVKLIQNIDVKSFKTIDVVRHKSEWETTLGIDKYNVYIGNKVLPRESSYQYYFSSKDSVYSQYFNHQ
jgi:hypothetical protein